MADKTDDLIISISTDLATVRRSLKRLESDVGSSTRKIEKQFDVMGRGINRSIEATASRLASTLAAAFSIRAVQQFVDSSTRITNALKVAGLQGSELTNVYDKLFASAQKNAAPLESLVTLYSRLALTQKELGVTQAELVGFTDKVALALRVGGTSAQEASGALLQLSQALGGGVVRAEEFNSVLEGTPTIVQAVAAGLKEAGGSVAKLRQLVIDGKISSQAFFRAFEAGSSILEEKVSGSVLTTSQSLEKLQNVLIDTAGKINTATGASEAFGKVIDDLSETIKQFGDVVVKASDGDLGKFLGWLSEGIDKAAQFKRIMGGIPGIIDKMGKLNQDLLNGKPLGTGISEGAIQGRINQAFDYPADPKTGRLPALPPGREIKTVSIADLPVAAGADKEAKKAETAAQKARNAYRDLLKSADDRIGQLRLETELLGQYGAETDAARFRLDLLQQSEDKGRSLSGPQKAAIEEKVAAYEKYSKVLAEAKLKQDLLDARRMAGLNERERRVADTLRQYGLPEDLGGDNASAIRKQLQSEELSNAANGFIDNLSGALLSGGEDIGKKLGEVLLSALMESAQKQLADVLKQLFSALTNPASGAASPVGSATNALNYFPAAPTSAASAFAAPVGAVTRMPLPAAGATKTGIGLSTISTANGLTADVNAKYGPQFQSLVKDLEGAGVDIKSIGGYNYRNINGTNKLSNHAFGNAIDINPATNPDTGRGGALITDMPAGVSDIAKRNGFDWGGDWKSKKDAMHFEIAQSKSAGAALEKLAGASNETTKGLGSLASSLTSGGAAGGGGWLSFLSGTSFAGSKQLAATGGIGLFDKGGYTGPGGKMTPAGIVHKGEYVFDAATVSRIGVPTLERLKGYANGGLVGAPVAPRLNGRRPAEQSSGGPSSMVVQIQGASGDPHVKELVRQGVAQALAEKNDNDRRGGIGTMQQRYTAQKG